MSTPYTILDISSTHAWQAQRTSLSVNNCNDIRRKWHNSGKYDKIRVACESLKSQDSHTVEILKFMEDVSGHNSRLCFKLHSIWFNSHPVDQCPFGCAHIGRLLKEPKQGVLILSSNIFHFAITAYFNDAYMCVFVRTCNNKIYFYFLNTYVSTVFINTDKCIRNLFHGM